MEKRIRLFFPNGAEVEKGTVVQSVPQHGPFAWRGVVASFLAFDGVFNDSVSVFVDVELDVETEVVTLLSGIQLGDEVFLNNEYRVSGSVRGPVVVVTFGGVVFAEWSPGNGTRYTAMASKIGHCCLSDGVGGLGLLDDGIVLTLGHNKVSYFVTGEMLHSSYVKEKWGVRDADLEGSTAVLSAAVAGVQLP
jgi:hypothetical protein